LRYQFKHIEINRNSLIVRTQAVDDPSKGQDYISHWHTMSPEQFEKRLKQLEEAIRSFRRQAIEEAQALDAEYNPPQEVEA